MNKWYCFRQNNSRGKFVGPKYILVEAPRASIANALAEDQGVYFGGCAAGIDCPCCGDRWYPMHHDLDATDSPCIYGEAVEPSDDVILVYLDGRVVGGRNNQ